MTLAAPLQTITGTAVLAGDLGRPLLYIRFGMGMEHASTGEKLQTWVKNLPSRRWNPDEFAWEVKSVGPNPTKVLAAAGLELIRPDSGPLSTIALEDLYTPVSKLDENNRTTLLLPRLMGYEGAMGLIQNSGVWDKKRELIRMPVIDVMRGASPRPGIHWDAASIARSKEMHERSPLLSPELGPMVAQMSNALEPYEVADSIRAIQKIVGGPVGKFGVDLFPYQVVGAYGVAAGHRLLADSPGVGKTFQTLAAASVLRADVLVVICPPVVTTNWGREIVKSGFAKEDEIAVFRPTRKEPTLEGKKAVVISDSSLASKRHLIFHLSNWMNEHEKSVVAYDEIHRAKTMGAQRSDAVLDMMALTRTAIPIGVTGTPVLSGPHELVNLLEFTGHLGPVFGGAGPFLEEFCRKDKYGAFHPKKAALPKLNRMLNEHVWMRRTKEQVLPFLPKRFITSVDLDVDLKEYRATHRHVVEQIVEWFEGFKNQEGRWPKEEEVEEFAQDNLRYASQLRLAAGLTKVPVALEMVKDWLQGNPDEPVLVWAHHKEVIAALVEAAAKLKVPAGVIDGSVSTKARDRYVDDFQANKIPLLICSITAAGVGITLTRSSHAIFVETDWTPAIVLQAIDRQHRIGQENTVHAEVLLALGTLDEHMQGKLAEKGETISTILGDDSNKVAVGGDRELMNLKDVMASLIHEARVQLRLTT